MTPEWCLRLHALRVSWLAVRLVRYWSLLHLVLVSLGSVTIGCRVSIIGGRLSDCPDWFAPVRLVCCRLLWSCYLLLGVVLRLVVEGSRLLQREVSYRVGLRFLLGLGPWSSVGLGGRLLGLYVVPCLLGCLGGCSHPAGVVVPHASPVPFLCSPQEEVSEFLRVVRRCPPVCPCRRALCHPRNS